MEEEYKESELSKIVKKLMDEEGYEFGEAVKEAIKKGYAYGGGVGHLLEPTQTYHQYHDFTAPMTVGAMVDNMYNRGGRVNYKKGGRGRQDRMGGTMEQTAAELRAVNPAEFGGGMNISYGGGNDGNNNPPVVIKNEPPVIPQDDKVEQNLITGKWMTNADLATKQKFLNYIDQNKSFNLGQDVDADTLYANYLEATGLDKHNKNVLVDSETINQRKEVDGNTIFDTRTTDETFKDLDKDWTTRNTTVTDTAGNTTTNRLTPVGMWENDVYLGNRGPQSMAIDPPKSFDLPGNDLRADLTKAQQKALGKQKMGYDLGLFNIDDVRKNIEPLGDPDKPATNEEITEFFQAKDGGRVGMFMGGDPLTGQALSIYESMNSYGFSDAEIASALQQQGLYTPPGSGTPTPDPTPDPTPGQGGGQGGGNNFSVYNPDPNRVQTFRKDPSVAPAMEALQRSQQLKAMGIDDPFADEATLEGAYYGDMPNFDDSPGQQTAFNKFKQGISGIVNQPFFKGISMMTPFGFAKQGITALKGLMPVNQRGITENIAGNLGVRVDDIGRIVNTGNYNTPEGVMAGYNLNNLTDESFEKRINTVSDTLERKGLDKELINQIIAGESALTDEQLLESFPELAMQTATGPKITNLISHIRNIKLAQDNIMGAKKLGETEANRLRQLKEEKKQQKKLEAATAAQKAQILKNQQEAAAKGDIPQKIYHQETKSQDRGGRDIGSRVSDSYSKQDSAQYGMIAKGGIAQYAPKKKGIASMFTRRR